MIQDFLSGLGCGLMLALVVFCAGKPLLMARTAARRARRRPKAFRPHRCATPMRAGAEGRRWRCEECGQIWRSHWIYASGEIVKVWREVEPVIADIRQQLLADTSITVNGQKLW